MKMIENVDLRRLEPFRSPAFPSLYILKDQKLIQTCISQITQSPFGIETGFGGEPARVFRIDRTIPWILTECDETIFNATVRPETLSLIWEDVSPNEFISIPPIFLAFMASNLTLEKQAKTIVYRNPNYNNMGMVPYRDLKPGQRVVIILDHHLIFGKSDIEWPKYHQFLTLHGYDPDQIIKRPASLPSLCNVDLFSRYAQNSRQFVLDVTK